MDLVAAENRRFYKPHRQDQNHPGKEDTKLDLSGLFRRDDKAKEEEEDEDEEDGQEMRDEEEEDDDSGQETYRVSEGRNRAVPVIATSSSSGLPRWDVRWPIDVWISCGEPFVPLKGQRFIEILFPISFLGTARVSSFLGQREQRGVCCIAGWRSPYPIALPTVTACKNDTSLDSEFQPKILWYKHYSSRVFYLRFNLLPFSFL